MSLRSKLWTAAVNRGNERVLIEGSMAEIDRMNVCVGSRERAPGQEPRRSTQPTYWNSSSLFHPSCSSTLSGIEVTAITFVWASS